MNQNNLYQEWFKNAEEDNKAIVRLLDDEYGPFSVVCFHAQQMAEKYLKGFLVYSNKEFPKVHQLEKLLQLCKNIDSTFKELDEESILLSEFYIETRYPGDWPEFFLSEAKKAYQAALKIKDFILERIK